MLWQCFSRRIGKAGIAILAIAMSLAVQTASCAAAPVLLTGHLQDRELARALQATFDLPTRLVLRSAVASSAADDLDLERRRLVALQRMFGYLDARVEAIAPGGAGKQAVAADVRLRPVPGALYRIGSIEILGLDAGRASAAARGDIADLLARFPGSVARADTLAALEDEIVFRMEADAHPFARASARSIVPDPASATARVQIAVDPGPTAQFGQLTVKGLLRVDSARVAELAPFSAGDPYTPEGIETLRERLTESGLFQRLRMEIGTSLDAAGRVPVELKVTERLPDAVIHPGRSGMLTIEATLALLAFRQLALAGGAPRRSRTFRIFDALVVVLLLLSAAFALQRVLLFLNIG